MSKGPTRKPEPYDPFGYIGGYDLSGVNKVQLKTVIRDEFSGGPIMNRTFDCDFSLTERVRIVPPPADAPMEEQEAYAESPFSIVPIAQLSCGLSMDPLTVMGAVSNPSFLEHHLDAIFAQLKQKVLQELSEYMYATRNGTRGMNPYESFNYETNDGRAKEQSRTSERSGTIPKRIGKGTPT